MNRVMVVLLGALFVTLLAMPVSAYTQYDTVFFHGTMGESDSASENVYFESDGSEGHTIALFPSSGAVYGIVNCPYFSYDSKQGGIQPRVRYLGLQYRTLQYGQIYAVTVHNGPDWVDNIEFNPPLKSTEGYTLKVIDLGDWYRFNRGLNMRVWTENPSMTDIGSVTIAGYGARYEW